jgi:hypothetical protein
MYCIHLERKSTETRHIRALANILSSEKSSLNKLQIRVLARVGSFTPVGRNGRSPYEGLEANLQPFQGVRGLSQVSILLGVCHSVTNFFSRQVALAAKWVTGA